MFNGVITSGPMHMVKKGDTGLAAALEKIAPGAS
jgi:hypothetical protein